MADRQKRTNLNDATSQIDERSGLSPRCCFISRKKLPRSAMLRFVYDGEHKLCLDTAGKLPGRGTWLALDRNALFVGVRCLLAREREPRTIEDFFQNNARLLEYRCLSYLSLARRAGLAIFGAGGCLQCARDGRLRALLCAREASHDERRKILRAQRRGRLNGQAGLGEPPCFAHFEVGSLGQVFAREQVVYAGLCEQDDWRGRKKTHGLVQRVLEELQRFASLSILLEGLPASNEGEQMLTKHGDRAGFGQGLPDGVTINSIQVDEERNHVGQ